MGYRGVRRHRFGYGHCPGDRRRLMPVPMMNVREVRVQVRQRRMPVRMRVWLAAIPGEIVRMLMVVVVRVAVSVLDGFVRVFMLMKLGQVQPYSHGHQRTGDQ